MPKKQLHAILEERSFQAYTTAIMPPSFRCFNDQNKALGCTVYTGL